MRRTIVISICFLFYQSLYAQDSSLLSVLKNGSIPANNKIAGTFKATHIVNMQTVEAPAKGDLNFIIMHRFGKINDGSYNFFGLDNATLRLGLDYGITDRLAVGIGRSSLEKTFDGYLKYKLLRQTDDGKMPLSVSLLETISNYTLKFSDKPYLNAKYRTAYVSQVLIARKINRSVSLQIAPSLLHFNLVPTTADKNTIFATTIGGRAKFTKRMGITAEYSYVPSGQVNSIDIKNSLSFGWDIETGGHVFQLVFSNSQGMTESQYIPRTTGSWGNGDIYFGFNISRNFTLKK
jgi:hypothetical protein